MPEMESEEILYFEAAKKLLARGRTGIPDRSKDPHHIGLVIDALKKVV
jgi:hypothetical protein